MKLFGTILPNSKLNVLRDVKKIHANYLETSQWTYVLTLYQRSIGFIQGVLHGLSMKAAIGAQRLSGRVLDSRPEGRGFEPYRRHCVVSLSKNINPSLVLVQSRKIHPYITERSLMGREESNLTNNKSRCFRRLVNHCLVPG